MMGFNQVKRKDREEKNTSSCPVCTEPLSNRDPKQRFITNREFYYRYTLNTIIFIYLIDRSDSLLRRLYWAKAALNLEVMLGFLSVRQADFSAYIKLLYTEFTVQPSSVTPQVIDKITSWSTNMLYGSSEATR